MRPVTHLQEFVAITRGWDGSDWVQLWTWRVEEGGGWGWGGAEKGLVFLEERDAAVKNASDSDFLRPVGDPTPPLHLPSSAPPPLWVQVYMGPRQVTVYILAQTQLKMWNHILDNFNWICVMIQARVNLLVRGWLNTTRGSVYYKSLDCAVFFFSPGKTFQRHQALAVIYFSTRVQVAQPLQAPFLSFISFCIVLSCSRSQSQYVSVSSTDAVKWFCEVFCVCVFHAIWIEVREEAGKTQNQFPYFFFSCQRYLLIISTSGLWWQLASIHS